MDILFLFSGAIVGGFLVWLISRSAVLRTVEKARYEADLQQVTLSERLTARENRITELQSELSLKETRLLELERSAKQLETRLEEAQRTIAEERALLEKLEERLRDTFSALSSEALEKNNQLFLDLAKTRFDQVQQIAESDLELRQKAIEQLVKPLQVSLTQMNTKIEEIDRQRSEQFGSITTQLRYVADSEAQLRRETANLVQALRTPRTRGVWGELQLRRVVEIAGMAKHCDFVEQESILTNDGKRRPDMIVKLPGRRQIMIDAKAPLQAYLEAIDTPDEETRKARLREHSEQMKRRIIDLSSKTYWEQFKEGTPEFVVMFLPGEAFLSAALEHNPQLFEFGFEHKVLIATPLTLIALLRTVAYVWHQEQITENALEIAQLGKTLHERIRTFFDRMSQLGKGLGNAVEAFNNAVSSLNHRVIPAAKHLERLGAKSSKDFAKLESLDPPAPVFERRDVEVDTAIGEERAVDSSDSSEDLFPRETKRFNVSSA